MVMSPLQHLHFVQFKNVTLLFRTITFMRLINLFQLTSIKPRPISVARQSATGSIRQGSQCSALPGWFHCIVVLPCPPLCFESHANLLIPVTRWCLLSQIRGLTGVLSNFRVSHIICDKPLVIGQGEENSIVLYFISWKLCSNSPTKWYGTSEPARLCSTQITSI